MLFHLFPPILKVEGMRQQNDWGSGVNQRPFFNQKSQLGGKHYQGGSY